MGDKERVKLQNLAARNRLKKAIKKRRDEGITKTHMTETKESYYDPKSVHESDTELEAKEDAMNYEAYPKQMRKVHKDKARKTIEKNESYKPSKSKKSKKPKKGYLD